MTRLLERRQNFTPAKALLLACLLGLMPGPVAQQVLPSKIVTTIADWPCSEWSARRGREQRTDPPQMWLVGYLTGMASAYRVDVLANIEPPQIFAWTDAWCASNAETSLSTGAQVLFRQLLEVTARGGSGMPGS